MGTVLSTASDGTELGQLTQTGQKDVLYHEALWGTTELEVLARWAAAAQELTGHWVTWQVVSNYILYRLFFISFYYYCCCCCVIIITFPFFSDLLNH